MPWPLASDFRTILQNPKIAFRDPDLRALSIERDVLGQPRAWAGAFAVVYKGIDESGNPRAIRVFSTESPQRRERYALVAHYLTDRRLECLVAFEYREEEIRSLSDGKRYPVVLMDWVEGETLAQWLQSCCRSGNVSAIADVAAQWPVLIAELSRQQIAHGDLQHGNVMVTLDRKLKLVDYDGMCVPALIGAECLEVGTPPYQHPERRAALRLSPRLDDFSALLIHVALQALATDPTLWTKYVERANNDAVLFREDDFRLPQKSALRAELRRSSSPQVREIVEHLFAAAAGDINRVPRLCDLIAFNAEPSAPPESATVAGGPGLIVSAPLQGSTSSHRSGALRAPQSGMPRRSVPAATMTRVAGYKIISELGKGPLATVYLAESEPTRQLCALKILPLRSPATELARRKFLLEIDRTAQVRHPHLLSLLERGTVGHAFYVVSEYCTRGNLLQWMERHGGRLSIADARLTLAQCLDALKQAHLHRLIHGRIAPQNILFTESGKDVVAKIADLGVAWHFAQTFGGQVPAAASADADRFVPPEQITSQRAPNPRSDMWSLAAVFYQALAGAYPWEFLGRNSREVVSSEAAIPLSQRIATMPPAGAAVIDRALSLSPVHRFSSVAEMKAAWDRAFSNPS